MHEAQQRAVRRSHQVDQAGLAVANSVRLWLEEESKSGGQSCSASTRTPSHAPVLNRLKEENVGLACAKLKDVQTSVYIGPEKS